MAFSFQRQIESTQLNPLLINSARKGGSLPDWEKELYTVTALALWWFVVVEKEGLSSATIVSASVQIGSSIDSTINQS